MLLGVHPASPVFLKSTVEDSEGQYVIAECGVEQELFTVVSVYFSPQTSASDLHDLLVDITVKVDHFGHTRVMWVSDFNVVLNPTVDTTTVTHHLRKAPRNALTAFMDNHELTDVWRSIHPFKDRYTLSTRITSGVVLSRTDFFLVSPVLLTVTVSASILDRYVSDHNPITYTFMVNTPEKGKGYWKFPEFLLQDEGFKQELATRIKHTVADNPDEEPGLLWDVIKLNTRGCAIDYMSTCKKKCKVCIKHIESRISQSTELRDRFTRDPYKLCSMMNKLKCYKMN